MESKVHFLIKSSYEKRTYGAEKKTPDDSSRQVSQGESVRREIHKRVQLLLLIKISPCSIWQSSAFTHREQAKQ